MRNRKIEFSIATPRFYLIFSTITLSPIVVYDQGPQNKLRNWHTHTYISVDTLNSNLIFATVKRNFGTGLERVQLQRKIRY